MKFGHLIRWKIFEFVATRCQIFRLKCTKFNFGCGSAQKPTGELIALPYLLDGFNVPTSKGGEGKGGKWERGRKNRGREEMRGKSRGRRGPPRTGSHPMSEILKIP